MAIKTRTALRCSLIAGLPRARSARGTEPHTRRIWSTSFRLVVTWLTERTYASTDCTGRVGRLWKGREGCLRCVLANPYLLYWPCTIWSIDSCQNRIATDQYHIAIGGSCVNSSRWRDLFGSCQLTSCFTSSQSIKQSISYFLAKLRAQENWSCTHPLDINVVAFELIPHQELCF